MARASSVRYLLGSARSRIAVQCSNAARLRAEPSARSHLESGGLRGGRGNRRVSKSKACGERSTDENGLLYSQFVQHTAGARVNPRARACSVRYQNCLHQSHRAPPPGRYRSWSSQRVFVGPRCRPVCVLSAARLLREGQLPLLSSHERS